MSKVRDDIREKFGESTKEELLEVLSKIADDVDLAEDPEVILTIQERLGQDRH